jgi:hypothetical protein
MDGVIWTIAIGWAGGLVYTLFVTYRSLSKYASYKESNEVAVGS